jgi:hypothetical protein
VVDKECAEVVKCVVLVVSGRLRIVADPDHRIDALVASWLPGSEGAGLADVLFGKEPFTGRLPVTWPAAATTNRSTWATRNATRPPRTAGACASGARRPATS